MKALFASRFISSLQVKRASDGEPGAWELTAPLVYQSTLLRTWLVVPVGFRTDFASVPRVPFAYLLFGNVADEAAVLHDYVYTNNVSGISREKADLLFLEACDVMGTPAWKSRPMWAAVRLFGKSHWGNGSPLPLPKEQP